MDVLVVSGVFLCGFFCYYEMSMDICVQVFVYMYVLISLEYLPSRRLAGSYNFIFNLWRKYDRSKIKCKS